MINYILKNLYVYAGTSNDPEHTVPKTADIGGVYTALVNIANWLFSFLIAVAVIGIVVSGFMFVFSGGDPGKAATARQMAIYSIIGVIVGGLGWALVNWAKELL